MGPLATVALLGSPVGRSTSLAVARAKDEMRVLMLFTRDLAGFERLLDEFHGAAWRRRGGADTSPCAARSSMRRPISA